MRVIGYARLSSGSEESTSITRQRETIERFAASRGWDLVGVVDDPVASATKLRLNRPGLLRVREAIASGEAAAVVVWRLDRIARSVVDFGTLLDEGVNVVSATEPLDTTTPMGRAMAEILQVFAAMEAASISARLRDSVHYLRRNARFPGGRVPYGYRTAPNPDGPGRVLELDPEAARVVREAAEAILSGRSAYAVARDLTARGVPTARGAEGWSVQALVGVLTGEAVLGRVVSRGELVRDEHGLPATVWPPILRPDEARDLRALLSPKTSVNRPRTAGYLLSGMLYCASCDSPMVYQRRRTARVRDGKAEAVYDSYRCTSRGNGRECARPVSVKAEWIESHVVGAFLGAVGRFPVTAEVVEASEPAALAEVEEALQQAAQAMTEPGADFPALVERLGALRARREELAALPSAPVVRLVETGRTYAEEWDALGDDLNGRRAVLARAIDHVRLSPRDAGGDPRAFDPRRAEILWTS
jgi:DNA invertase Pin-like site-specific DNA recombinase